MMLTTTSADRVGRTEAHQQTTNPETRLYGKGCRKESKLAYLGRAPGGETRRPHRGTRDDSGDGLAERGAVLMMLTFSYARLI